MDEDMKKFCQKIKGTNSVSNFLKRSCLEGYKKLLGLLLKKLTGPLSGSLPTCDEFCKNSRLGGLKDCSDEMETAKALQDCINNVNKSGNGNIMECEGIDRILREMHGQ
jgi:hypothetical protein